MSGLPLHGDYRLADFRLLLPCGPDVVAEGIRLDPYLTRLLAADLPRLERSCLASPDLVIAGPGVVAPPVPRPGGLLAHLFEGAAPAPQAGFEPAGRWLARPGWPAFRHLVPDDAGMLTAGTRLGAAPGAVPAGLSLSRAPGGEPLPTLLERVSAAAGLGLPAGRWIVYSGRLGEGNPMLAFGFEEDGEPRHVLKVSRFPGQPHLREEARAIAEVCAELGPELSARVVAPSFAGEVASHPCLGYRFLSSLPLHGPLFRVFRRERLLRQVAEWLGSIARRTGHPLAADELVAPLQRLLAGGAWPAALAAEARAALPELRELARARVGVREHGDLGPYNLRLLDPRGGFAVIDWGSTRADGLAGADLAVLLASTRAPRALAGRLLARYAAAAGLPPTALRPLWLAWLARTWELLDEVRGRVPGDPLPGGRILLPLETRVAAYGTAAPAARTA